jgi:hypothetical protein
MNASHLAKWGSVVQRAQLGVQSMRHTSERRMEAASFLLRGVVKGEECGP